MIHSCFELECWLIKHLQLFFSILFQVYNSKEWHDLSLLKSNLGTFVTVKVSYRLKIRLWFILKRLIPIDWVSKQNANEEEGEQRSHHCVVLPLTLNLEANIFTKDIKWFYNAQQSLKKTMIWLSMLSHLLKIHNQIKLND